MIIELCYLNYYISVKVLKDGINHIQTVSYFSPERMNPIPQCCTLDESIPEIPVGLGMESSLNRKEIIK